MTGFLSSLSGLLFFYSKSTVLHLHVTQRSNCGDDSYPLDVKAAPDALRVVAG
jgi:hypothetical protein